MFTHNRQKKAKSVLVNVKNILHKYTSSPTGLTVTMAEFSGAQIKNDLIGERLRR